jgi:hypothetical protein
VLGTEHSVRRVVSRNLSRPGTGPCAVPSSSVRLRAVAPAGARIGCRRPGSRGTDRRGPPTHPPTPGSPAAPRASVGGRGASWRGQRRAPHASGSWSQ